MTTLNISIPEAMRAYVEQQAAAGHYSASEYLRHLIREDQKKKEQEETRILHDYLALCARQLDEGETGSLSIEKILTQGRRRRKNEA